MLRACINSNSSHLILAPFRDENLFDRVMPDPSVSADVLIEVTKIQWAVQKLRNSTSFLSDIEVLDQTIPVVETSINEIVAGRDRSVADLFDLTGERFRNELCVDDDVSLTLTFMLPRFIRLGQQLGRDSNRFRKS